MTDVKPIYPQLSSGDIINLNFKFIVYLSSILKVHFVSVVFFGVVRRCNHDTPGGSQHSHRVGLQTVRKRQMLSSRGPISASKFH